MAAKTSRRSSKKNKKADAEIASKVAEPKRKTARSAAAAADVGETKRTGAKASRSAAPKAAGKSAVKSAGKRAAAAAAGKSTDKPAKGKVAKAGTGKRAAESVGKTPSKSNAAGKAASKSAPKSGAKAKDAKSATAKSAKAAKAAKPVKAGKAGRTSSAAAPAEGAAKRGGKRAAAAKAPARTAGRPASARTAAKPATGRSAGKSAASKSVGGKPAAGKSATAKGATAKATRGRTAASGSAGRSTGRSAAPARTGARRGAAVTTGRSAAAPTTATRGKARAATTPATKSSANSGSKSGSKFASKSASKSAVAAAPSKPGRKPASKTLASNTPASKPPASEAPASKTSASKTSASTRRASGGAKGRTSATPPAHATGLSAAELSRERAAGRVKRAVRRAVSSVGEAASSAIKPAPRPTSALRPDTKPRPRAAARKAGGPQGVAVKGRMGPRYTEILSPGALAFLAELHRKFEERRRELLEARRERQARFDAGELPDFLAETQEIRDGDWTVGPIPADLQDRRVEITGPVDRKMIVNALNSGATHFMADFEDANSPTWTNVIEGQINLRDRFEDKIDFTDETSGKRYALGDDPAVLIVRPRGWHLVEEHLTVDGEPISAALFDFGLYVFHNAKTLLARGTGPYFYVPKLESHLEARLWNEVFVHAQEKLGIPHGTIKATVLIETLPGGFEMDEILYELRDHAAGLNAGRWDYIFSFIKKLAKRADYVLPDRGQVVMGKAFLGAYATLLVKTCHRRRAFAMGGMAAQIPIKNDPAANEAAFAKVRADKEREVNDGHDGTWVAHPDLVPVAKEVFDRLMPQPNQVDRQRDDVVVGQEDLLRIHEGTKTEDGFRLNIRVGVQYIEAWLRGRGAVPIYNLMEDAATAEISRAQIWQWLQYGAVLENGIAVTPEFFETALGEEMDRVKEEIGAEAYDAGRFPEAIDLFRRLSLAPEFEDFLTLPAYKLIA